MFVCLIYGNIFVSTSQMDINTVRKRVGECGKSNERHKYRYYYITPADMVNFIQYLLGTCIVLYCTYRIYCKTTSLLIFIFDEILCNNMHTNFATYDDVNRPSCLFNNIFKNIFIKVRLAGKGLYLFLVRYIKTDGCH